MAALSGSALTVEEVWLVNVAADRRRGTLEWGKKRGRYNKIYFVFWGGKEGGPICSPGKPVTNFPTTRVSPRQLPFTFMCAILYLSRFAMLRIKQNMFGRYGRTRTRWVKGDFVWVWSLVLHEK